MPQSTLIITRVQTKSTQRAPSRNSPRNNNDQQITTALPLRKESRLSLVSVSSLSVEISGSVKTSLAPATRQRETSSTNEKTVQHNSSKETRKRERERKYREEKEGRRMRGKERTGCGRNKFFPRTPPVQSPKYPIESQDGLVWVPRDCLADAFWLPQMPARETEGPTASETEAVYLPFSTQDAVTLLGSRPHVRAYSASLRTVRFTLRRDSTTTRSYFVEYMYMYRETIIARS